MSFESMWRSAVDRADFERKRRKENSCPGCGVQEGEIHIPDCPVYRSAVSESEKFQASPRARLIPLAIVVTSIPHQDQRYDTCGDYQEAHNVIGLKHSPAIHITVSELSDRREMLLIAIHELIEWALCETAGVSNSEIDQFDLDWPRVGSPVGIGEPGDDSRAPYYRQHQIASGIERLLAAEMKVDWLEYERHINELEYKK